MFPTSSDLSVIDPSFADPSGLRADVYVFNEHSDTLMTFGRIAAGIAQTILSYVPPNLLYRHPHRLE
jgi:hypothetical protein